MITSHCSHQFFLVKMSSYIKVDSITLFTWITENQPKPTESKCRFWLLQNCKTESFGPGVICRETDRKPTAYSPSSVFELFVQWNSHVKCDVIEWGIFHVLWVLMVCGIGIYNWCWMGGLIELRVLNVVFKGWVVEPVGIGVCPKAH